MANGALVLAGGGLAGIAWETGVLLGIQQVEPAAAASIFGPPTTLVGTSAGSVVAAQLAGGTALDELFATQLAPYTAEVSVDVDLVEFGAKLMGIRAAAATPEDALRAVGAMALEVDTSVSPARRAAIDARLPVKEWGDRRLLITAVDASSGEFRVFDRDSGVPLVDAVGASCAVPGIWPTVEIDGVRYMDGGSRSLGNVDVAKGADRVLVLVPAGEVSPLGQPIPDEELAALAPARVHLVFADDASLASFGTNPLDPATRKPAAEAGLALGRQIATQVAEFWSE